MRPILIDHSRDVVNSYITVLAIPLDMRLLSLDQLEIAERFRGKLFPAVGFMRI